MAGRVDCFIVLDFETGGLKYQYCPITEVGMQMINPDTYAEVDRYTAFIKSEPKMVDDKYKPNLIPKNVYKEGYYFAGALRTTGITVQQLKKEGKDYVEVANAMADFFSKAHIGDRYAKPILVGQNLGFDIPFLQKLFELSKIDLSKLLTGYEDVHGNFTPFFIDTMHDCKRAFPKNEKFNLGALCQSTGTEIIDAHRAINDVIPTSNIFAKMSLSMRNQGKGETAEKEKRRKHFQM